MPEKPEFTPLSRKEQLDLAGHELAQRKIMLEAELKRAREDRDAALGRAVREEKRSAKYAGELKGDIASGVALVERDNAREHDADMDRAYENMTLLQEAHSRHIDERHDASAEDDPDRTEEAPMPDYGTDDLAA